MSLEIQTAETVKKLERYERNWHIFRAVLYTAIGLTIIITNIFTFHRLYDNSDKNRRLLRCTIVALTNPDPSQQNFRISLQVCLDNTK